MFLDIFLPEKFIWNSQCNQNKTFIRGASPGVSDELIYSPCTEDFYISILSYPSTYIQHPTYYTHHPTSYILYPTSSILHPASSILHPASNIKSLSNSTLSYPIQHHILDYICRNQNTMLTSDSIIYFLGHLCNKEIVYTSCLFSVSLKLILTFLQDSIGWDRIG